MSVCIRYTCGNCGKTIDAWDEGNPYYLDDQGVKRYTRCLFSECSARLIGNDVPHLCLDCGEEFLVDTRAPVGSCPKCGSTSFSDTFRLEGRTCPYCKTGVFACVPDFYLVP